MIHLSRLPNTIYKFNWCKQVEKLFENIEERIIWDLQFIKDNKIRLIDA